MTNPEMNEPMDIPMTEEDLMAMLKELEQEIGIEEMNRRLTNAMEFYAETNPGTSAEKVLLIQKGNLEDMLMAEEEVNFEDAANITAALHTYYENESDETFGALMMEIAMCKMNDGAVLIPVEQVDGRLDMPLLAGGDEAGEDLDWIAIYTNRELTAGWPGEAEFRPISLDLITLLANVKSGFAGVIFNPGTPEPLPLDRELLSHMERACAETREEEARLDAEKQNGEQPQA